MRRIKLTKEEREIENALLRGEYVPVSKAESEEIRKAITRKRRELALKGSRKRK